MGYHTGRSNDFWKLSILTLEWIRLDGPEVTGTAPPGRNEHDISVVGSDIFVFGGVLQSNGVDNKLYKFSTISMAWSEVEVTGDRPSGKKGLRMTAVGTDIFVFGGEMEVDLMAIQIYV